MRGSRFLMMYGLVSAFLASCGTTSSSDSNFHPGVLSRNGTVTLSIISSYSFGTVNLGQSVSANLTLLNDEPTDITNLAALTPHGSTNFAYTEGSFPGSEGTCGTTLASGATCSLNVTFTPSFLSGEVCAVFPLTYIASAGGQLTGGTLTSQFYTCGTPTAYSGTLVQSFGTNGSTTFDTGISGFEVKKAQAQGDGKILIVGMDYSTNPYTYDLYRFNTDGSLDNTFASSGKFDIQAQSGNAGVSLALQGDGKILLSLISATGANTYDIVRLTTSGTYDVTFNGSGIATASIANITGGQSAPTLVPRPDGAIFAVGAAVNTTTYYQYTVAMKLTASGAFDTAFGGNGNGIFLQQIDPNFMTGTMNSAMLSSDGKVWAFGTGLVGSSTGNVLARFNDTGLDMSFNGTGYQTISAGSATSAFGMFPLANGSFLVSTIGRSAGGLGLVEVLSLDSTLGTLINNFSGSGSALYADRTYIDQSNPALAALASAKNDILLAAVYYDYAANIYVQTISRLAANGMIDTTFGADGSGKTEKPAAYMSSAQLAEGPSGSGQFNWITVDQLNGAPAATITISRLWH